VVTALLSLAASSAERSAEGTTLGIADVPLPAAGLIAPPTSSVANTVDGAQSPCSNIISRLFKYSTLSGELPWYGSPSGSRYSEVSSGTSIHTHHPDRRHDWRDTSLEIANQTRPRCGDVHPGPSGGSDCWKPTASIPSWPLLVGAMAQPHPESLARVSRVNLVSARPSAPHAAMRVLTIGHPWSITTPASSAGS
jgi:hypothetical protein